MTYFLLPLKKFYCDELKLRPDAVGKFNLAIKE